MRARAKREPDAEYALAAIAPALSVTIAACSDLSEPVQQKAETGEQRDAIEAVDAPTDVEKGVVADVIGVHAAAAVR